MTSTNAPTPKDLAKLLRQDLAARGVGISHSLALELVAHQHGARDWNTLSARTRGRSADRAVVALEPGVPVLRVMSADTAVRFYRDYLGFTLDWEHRFDDGMPLYVQVSRSETVLHLSEHHGDGSPHGVVWIPVNDVHALLAELRTRPENGLRPDVDDDGPGGPTLEIIDPYGNVLRFATPAEDS